MADFEKIASGFDELDEPTVLAELEKVVAEGADATQALQACQAGLDLVGKKFETGYYFIGDLIFAGEIMKEAVDILSPVLAESDVEAVGKVVFCTVKGDVHDIGKNIVISLLRAGGFEVVDLGIDVAPEKVVEAVKEHDADIVALSGVLTLAIPSMKNTIEALKDAGLRDSVKVMIGGSPVTEEVCDIVGADFWTKNPQKGVAMCREWVAA